MLATGSLVGTATAFRVGSGNLELLARRGPSLAWLAVKASMGSPETVTAGATFRDELIGLARDSAELVWHELRRGVDDLDALTRTDNRHPARRPRRPYRVKP